MPTGNRSTVPPIGQARCNVPANSDICTTSRLAVNMKRASITLFSIDCLLEPLAVEARIVRAKYAAQCVHNANYHVLCVHVRAMLHDLRSERLGNSDVSHSGHFPCSSSCRSKSLARDKLSMSLSLPSRYLTRYMPTGVPHAKRYGVSWSVGIAGTILNLSIVNSCC